MNEYSRIIIEEYCMNHPKTKNLRNPQVDVFFRTEDNTYVSVQARKHMLRRSLRASHVLQCLYVTWGEPIFSCVNRYDVRMRKGNQMEYRQSDGRIVLMKVGNATGGKSRTDNIYPATRHHIKRETLSTLRGRTNNDNKT